MKPVLKEKSELVEKLVDKVVLDSTAADAVRRTVQAEKDEVDKMKMEIQAVAEDAQKDLDQAMPVFEKALLALNRYVTPVTLLFACL